MITARAFAGRHFAVLGLARSGLASVAALVASGARVTAWDEREQARTAGAAAGAQIEDFEGGDLTRFDSLVVTPGLPLNRHPVAQAARAAGVEIIGDIELFARARPELAPHRVVAITGTNGKSTTTALVHHLLAQAGVETRMGGNIGLPILAQPPLGEGGVYVLELSSYQIDLTTSLDCEVAVLLNITPDHLDRYDGMEGYAASKARLFAMQDKAHQAILLSDGPEVCALAARLAREGRKLVHLHRLSEVDDRDWPALKGPHNAQNAAAAIAAVSALGVGEGTIAAGLASFGGLPHRMERVATRDGIVFVNDSKATNPEAAAPALSAFAAIRWIVGGQAKGAGLGALEQALGGVVKAYTIGEAGPMFAELLEARGIAVARCGTLENAVRQAAEDSQRGETLLLSPACASFDQFSDFEARGEAFRRAVESL